MSTSPEITPSISLETPPCIFQAWLTAFITAVSATRSDDVAKLFLPHGWFRDILTFTWDLRALRGPAKISAFLNEHLPSLTLQNIRPDTDPFLLPHYVPESNQSIIEAAFTYETPIAYGRGYVQLAKVAPGQGWLALLVCITLTDLKGHEEPRDPIDWEAEAQGRAYGELVAERHRQNERDPHVLIGSYPPLTFPFSGRWITEISRSWCGSDGPAGCGEVQTYEHPITSD